MTPVERSLVECFYGFTKTTNILDEALTSESTDILRPLRFKEDFGLIFRDIVPFLRAVQRTYPEVRFWGSRNRTSCPRFETFGAFLDYVTFALQDVLKTEPLPDAVDDSGCVYSQDESS